MKFLPQLEDAIRDGRKTMTRRPVEPQPYWSELSGRWHYDIPEQFHREGCSTQCVTASREWFEYLPQDAYPYKVGDTFPLSDGTTCEITKVRAERLQDISAVDAELEGVAHTEFWTPKEMNDRPFEEKWWDDFYFWSHYPQIVFKRLWDSIYGPGSWDRNDWVWVVEFKVVTAPQIIGKQDRSDEQRKY